MAFLASTLLFLLSSIGVKTGEQEVTSCAQYGRPDLSIELKQICVCPNDTITCPSKQRYTCVRNETVCKMCSTGNIACAKLIDAHSGCQAGSMLINCTTSSADAVYCVTKSAACNVAGCNEGKKFLYKNKCETPATLCKVEIEPQKVSFDGKDDRVCGVPETQGSLIPVRLTEHPDSPCISPILVCGKCVPSNPTECHGEALCDPGQVLWLCSPGTTTGSVPSTKAVCYNETLLTDCGEKRFSCGAQFGNQCVNMSIVEDACKKAAGDVDHFTDNPEALKFKALTLGLPIVIASVGAITLAGALISSIPMIKATIASVID